VDCNGQGGRTFGSLISTGLFFFQLSDYMPTFKEVPCIMVLGDGDAWLVSAIRTPPSEWS
jgi:hypothetical protein